MLVLLEVIISALIGVLCLSALFKAETKERSLAAAQERSYQALKDEADWKPNQLFTGDCSALVSTLGKSSLSCKKKVQPNHPEVKDVLLIN